MKWNFRQTKKPGDGWDANRQSGYDWDEDGVDDFSYESVNDEGENDGLYDGAEPEDVEVEPYGESRLGYEGADESADGSYASEPEYVAEQQEYPVGQEYAQELDYVPEQEYGAGVEYAGEPAYAQEEYAQEVSGGQDGEYAEEAVYDQEEEYAQEAAYGQSEESFDEFQGEITYIEDFSEQKREARPSAARRRKEAEEDREGFGFFDGAVAIVGVAVILVLMAFIGWFYLTHKNPENVYDQFASIGKQLQDIELIGGKGIAAVANAELAKLTPDDVDPYDDPYDDPEEGVGNGYDESDYKNTISVVMNLTSVQKDLKIKLRNRETSKLIGNIRFVAEVKKPDGTVEEWTDSDMDGIIYKEDIAAGKYSVTLKALSDEKYSNYILPATSQTVTVKKDIDYSKVDVAGEGKTESEINANQEDTKKNETTVEGELTDTVVWVPSTVTGNTYTEVLKSTIPDPLTLPITVAKNFMRITEATEPTAAPTESPDPTEEPTDQPTAEPTATPTPPPVENPTPTPTPEVTPSPSPSPDPVESPSPEPVETSMELDVEKLELKIRKSADGSGTTAENGIVKATVKGFASGKDIAFEVVSADNAIATAAVDSNGKITVIPVAKGTTKITVSADYKNEADKSPSVVTKTSKVITVTVTEKEALALSLDKTELLCYSEVTDSPAVLEVTIRNSEKKAADLVEANMKFTAETSDSSVAQVLKKEFVPSTADGTVKIKLTMAPQILTEKKSCILTLKYEEGTESVVVKCTVTVKPHPKYDKKTLLQDQDGNQIFVAVKDDYREATYADYYVADAKFFVQSGVKYTGWQTINGKVYFFDANGKYVTGEQVIQGAKYTFGPDGALMSGSGVLGIDVSKWNGSIDWKAVKNSGVTFVIIRCGYRGSVNPVLVVDPKFTANIKGATDAGLKVGVYFFTQAVNEVEAVYEASYVLDLIKNYKITYPVFLDVEASGGRADKIDKDTRTKVCKAFCQTIQNSGYTAGIYANKNWLTEKIDVSQLNNFRIWLAQYAATPTYTGRYDMWQYKSTGRINGISGDVDMNLSYMGY